MSPLERRLFYAIVKAVIGILRMGGFPSTSLEIEQMYDEAVAASKPKLPRPPGDAA